MNNNTVHIDINIIKIIYFRYKDYLLPCIFFIGSWAIFIFFVLPQIQNFLQVQQEVTASEQTLATLTQNYNTLVTLPTSDIQKYVAIANQAVPQVKDFAGILNAISTAAGVSGVTVNDYSFQVGDLTSGALPAIGNNQTVQISLTIKGDVPATKQFVIALSRTLPLSEVTSINLTANSSTAIGANFFFSPLPKISFIDTSPLRVLSAADKKTLDTLATQSLGVVSTTLVASSPATVIPTPQVSPTRIGTSAAE